MEKLIEILEAIDDSVDYSNEEDLIGSGIFTSFEILQCITEIEDAFDIIIPPQKIMPDNFRSAQKIWEMIQECSAQ